MADSEIPPQGLSIPNLNPRKIGKINTIGLITLVQKECSRFTNVYLQTIVTPMITTLLFYAIFALAFGGDKRMVGDVPYLVFLAPGLIMMSMLQNAFANTSSSIMISKVQGNIVDVLMPPLSAFEILFGYTIAGMFRGLIVGAACVPAILLFCPIHVYSIFALLGFGILGCMLLSMMGVAAGLWAEKFDHLAGVTNFLIVPMTFLSGTFYSIHVLPELWRNIAYINPFFFIIDGFRYALTGHAQTSLWMGFGLLFQLNIGLFIFTYAMLLTGYKTKS
ncbi:MAG: multidrug transporter permease [Micavibrio sp.]|nr:multidrug transporter permease [Micavibrio sp.]